MKRTRWLLIFGALYFVMAGCMGQLPGSGSLKAIGIEAKVRHYAPIGSSIIQVDHFLQRQRIEHSNHADGTGSITRGIIRFTRSGFLISEHLKLIFMFDYRGRLIHYAIEPVGDGP